MYEERSEEGPRGTFESYRAEGDGLYKNGEFKKSIEAFTTALELQPADKSCLVARSRCYLQLGDPDSALNDAEESLSDDKEFHKGLFQKAEALYCKGEFELALVFYHRGHKLRPELQEFRLGIQKAQEAIDNSVGTPDRVTLTKEGDLSFFHKQDESKVKAKPKSYGYNRQAAPVKKEYRRPAPRSASSDKTIKQLLGELYGDKIYLEKLLEETDPHSESGRSIYELVCDGLRYLDTRSDFWRQQKPMYSRKRDKMMISQKVTDDKINTFIVRELEKIDEAQADGRFAESLKKSKKVMKTVESSTIDVVSNKHEVMANLHSLMGNAYLELGQYDKALEAHNVDLNDYGVKHKFEEAKSRAYDNLGRVYARMGEFQKAIDSWTTKLPLSKSALETTWLYHEIGRCHLELGNFDTAREYGEKSSAAAIEADDRMWQLNATVLIAQAEVKLNDLQSALQSFEKALDMAKLQGDEAAEGAIKRAVQDVNNKIVKGLKENEEPDGETEDAEGKPASTEAADDNNNNNDAQTEKAEEAAPASEPAAEPAAAEETHETKEEEEE